jgi:uracil-DNA glycosylase
MVHLGNDWDEILSEEFRSPYYLSLREFLKTEYSTRRIFPPMNDIFSAFKASSFKNTRVVIIGQDPYHGLGQAHGLCFSVKKGVAPPPSLKNIYKEINDDLGLPIPDHGQLSAWARQGVLMLNSVLTVREGAPTSHKDKGWETFTDNVIKKLNEKQTPIVFLLWGTYAQKKGQLITNPVHYKLCAAHPSPLSAYSGFFGCKHFSKTNEILEKHGLEPIDWRV